MQVCDQELSALPPNYHHAARRAGKTGSAANAPETHTLPLVSPFAISLILHVQPLIRACHALDSCAVSDSRKPGKPDSFSTVAVASDAAAVSSALPPRMRPRSPWPEPMEETMRVISQAELARLSRTELQVLLRQITEQLPILPEGSYELRIAHYNLFSLRQLLARAEPRPFKPV